MIEMIQYTFSHVDLPLRQVRPALDAMLGGERQPREEPKRQWLKKAPGSHMGRPEKSRKTGADFANFIAI
jgi:hypothetical protein